MMGRFVSEKTAVNGMRVELGDGVGVGLDWVEVVCRGEGEAELALSLIHI